MNRAGNKQDLHTTLQKGQLRTGVVKKIDKLGATVNLEGGGQGTVHISEILRVGDEVRVTIRKIDTKQQRLWLSMKATEPHPWDTASQRYSVDAEVTGIVRNFVNYGDFVEIERGFEGLLHVNDISGTRKINHPSEILEKGQKIKCRILSLDRQRRRIKFGLKQLEENPTWRLEQVDHECSKAQEDDSDYGTEWIVAEGFSLNMNAVKQKNWTADCWKLDEQPNVAFQEVKASQIHLTMK
jgi:ribosomal protein S1